MSNDSPVKGFRKLGGAAQQPSTPANPSDPWQAPVQPPVSWPSASSAPATMPWQAAAPPTPPGASNVPNPPAPPPWQALPQQPRAAQPAAQPAQWSASAPSTPYVAASSSDAVVMGLMQKMAPDQQQIFLMQYNAAKKDLTVGIILALFLGGVGAHKFYMGETGMGIFYLLFCWTGIPVLISIIDIITMSNKVNDYNRRKALDMAAMMHVTP